MDRIGSRKGTIEHSQSVRSMVIRKHQFMSPRWVAAVDRQDTRLWLCGIVFFVCRETNIKRIFSLWIWGKQSIHTHTRTHALTQAEGDTHSQTEHAVAFVFAFQETAEKKQFFRWWVKTKRKKTGRIIRKSSNQLEKFFSERFGFKLKNWQWNLEPKRQKTKEKGRKKRRKQQQQSQRQRQQRQE